MGLKFNHKSITPVERTGVQVTQGFVRSLDRKMRMTPATELNTNGVMKERLEAMIRTACQLLSNGAPEVDIDQLHRLNKADTKQGIAGIKNLSRNGICYLGMSGCRRGCRIESPGFKNILPVVYFMLN